MHLFNQKYWRRLARKDWLVNGDRHARFFHQTMKARKTTSKVLKLKDPSRVCFDESFQMESMFVNEFATWFKSAQTSYPNIQLNRVDLVTTDDNELWLQVVHDCEIKDAIFQMDKFKTPGPDGFGAAFFKDHWNIVKEDVCTAVKFFFEERKLLW